MRSSFIISLALHGLLFIALITQWRAVVSMHGAEIVYSIRIVGPLGGGGSGGGGKGGMKVTTPAASPKNVAPPKGESTVAVPKKEKPKEKSEESPEPQVPPLSDLEQEVQPLQGAGGGGGGGGSGSGWGTGSGSGVGSGSGGYGYRNAVVEPKPLYIPWPKYPAGMKAIPQGTVELELLVSERGEVQEVKVVRKLPREELNAIAVQAAMKIRFSPGIRSGVPSPMWVRLAIGFQPR